MEVNNVKGWWALKPAEWDHGNKYCQPIKEWPKSTLISMNKWAKTTKNKEKAANWGNISLPKMLKTRVDEQ